MCAGTISVKFREKFPLKKCNAPFYLHKGNYLQKTHKLETCRKENQKKKEMAAIPLLPWCMSFSNIIFPIHAEEKLLFLRKENNLTIFFLDGYKKIHAHYKQSA